MALVVAMGVAGAGVAAPDAALASTPFSLMPSDAGQYFPVTPVKVLDTRDGTGGAGQAPLAAGATVSFPVTGVGTVPATGVSDVYVIINVISPTAAGCMDEYDAAVSDPGVCGVSFDVGNNAADSDIVAASSGSVSVTNNSTGTADVAVTVMGYYQAGNAVNAASGDTYTALPQAQLVDTRSGLGAPEAQIPGGGSLTVQIAGQGGIPATAVGAALYIGAANASSTGYVSAYPTGGTASSLALLTYVPGQVVHQLYYGALSSAGQLTIVNQGASPVDLTVAVQGYLAGPTATAAGSTYQDVPEDRIADTRSGTGGVPAMPVPPNGSITFTATGTDGVPSTGVSSVSETVRAMNAQDTGYLSVYAAGGTDPDSPGVNFYAAGNQDIGLTATLVSSVGTAGQQTITNHSSGTVDIVVAIRGYYATPTVPAAPDAVDFSVSGQSATVTWQAPSAGDGGSPITSYTVTAPPDTATATVDGNTFQATLTGLTNAAGDDFTVTAGNAVGASPGADNEYEASGATSAEQDLGVSVDPTTGDETLVDDNASETTTDSSGNTTTVALTPDTADMKSDSESETDANVPAADVPAAGQDCDGVKTKSSVPVKTHSSFNNGNHVNGSFSFNWLNHLFSIPDALDIGRTEQWEAIICTAGGGHSLASGWKTSLVENAILTNSTDENTLWNQDWGYRTTSTSSVSSHISWTLGGSYEGIGATVGGTESSTTVKDNSEDTGSDSGDGHYGGIFPASLLSYDPTRVNADWQANDKAGQSNDWDGNTASVIYVYPEGSSGHVFYSVTILKMCGNSPVLGYICAESKAPVQKDH